MVHVLAWEEVVKKVIGIDCYRINSWNTCVWRYHCRRPGEAMEFIICTSILICMLPILLKALSKLNILKMKINYFWLSKEIYRISLEENGKLFLFKYGCDYSMFREIYWIVHFEMGNCVVHLHLQQFKVRGIAKEL